MAAPPIGSEAPEPLNTTWLVAYAGLETGDVQELNKHVIEEACIIKRGDKWTSSLYVTDQRFLEREYRFYSELAVIAAQAELASLEQQQTQTDEDDEEQLSRSMTSTSLSRSMTSTSLSGSMASTSKTWRPAKRDILGVRPGVMPSPSVLQATGVDGSYEVMRPRVSIYCSPSTKASLLGVLHRHTLVRGLAFASADGEPWLMLHEDVREDANLQSEAAFVPISMKSLGCGDLLKKLPGRPKPGRNEWRPSAANEVAVVKPKEFERWTRLTQRLLARALQLPRCLAASWKGTPETFVLVLERLALPAWTCAHTADGCTFEQARAAIESLAGFHATFADDRKLTGLQWLPTMPLHEYTSHMQATYRNCFQEHRGYLMECTTPTAFAVLEKFCGYYARLADQLAQPPLTLLHGNFQPGSLRFSTESKIPTVAAYDWQFVCRGRGAYDFAMFLGLLGPPEVREELEMELMVRYLMRIGKCGREARAEFKKDVRAGLLVAFAVFFINVTGKISAEPTPEVMLQLQYSIEWFSWAIQDWDCAECIGGVSVGKPPKRKRKYVKKSPRKRSPAKNKEGTATDANVGTGGSLGILGQARKSGDVHL